MGQAIPLQDADGVLDAPAGPAKLPGQVGHDPRRILVEKQPQADPLIEPLFRIHVRDGRQARAGGPEPTPQAGAVP
jgi:hypothetical protein